LNGPCEVGARRGASGRVEIDEKAGCCATNANIDHRFGKAATEEDIQPVDTVVVLVDVVA
jgi:hypothetical protein